MNKQSKSPAMPLGKTGWISTVVLVMLSTLAALPQAAAGGNQAPVSGPDLNIDMDEDTTNNFVLAGTDPEMDPLSAEITSYSAAQAGSTLVDGSGAPVIVGSIIGDRQLFFTPQENTFGPNYAVISYRVNDGTQNSANTATVTLSVNSINDLPFATLQTPLVMDEDLGPLNFDMGGQDIEGDVFECQILQVIEDITAGQFDWISGLGPVSVVDASGRTAMQLDFGANPWSMQFSPFFADQCDDLQFYQFTYRFNEIAPIVLGDSNSVIIQVRCINDAPEFSVAGFGSQNLASFTTLLDSDSVAYTLPVLGLSDVDGAASPANSGPNPGTQRISITSTAAGSVFVNEAGFPGTLFTSSSTSIVFDAVLTTADAILATLTYTAGAGTTTDTLTILANDGGSNQGCADANIGSTCPLSAAINIDISIGVGGAVPGVMPLSAGSGGFITVNTNVDDGLLDGLCSLRDAVDAANTNVAVDGCSAGSGNDIILMPTSIFPINLGALSITEPLSIIGAGDALTLIDGGGLGQVFMLSSSLSLRDLSIIGEDSDGDGISTPVDGELVLGSFVDQAGMFSNQFTDEHLGGSTFGTILNRSGHLVTVMEAAAPDGVNIAASGGIGSAEISVCGALVQLNDGQSRLLSCIYTIGGTLAGLGTGSVTLQNNIGDDLVLSANGAFSFTSAQPDLADYSVTVQTQPTAPNQTCLVSGGNSGSNDGSGAIAGTSVTSIAVSCNTVPTPSMDAYTINEDATLVASDADGSVNDASDDGVLANDLDAESDALAVVNPGTFSTTGFGGTLVIAADGTFTYTPPANQSGQAGFAFEVTDGINTVPSSLSITVQAVNDPPSFNILSDFNAFDQVSVGNTQLSIPGFANTFVFGPADESTQSVLQFNLVVSDSNSILSSIDLTPAGSLDLDFSLNQGVALVEARMQDDGGVANSGVDTSAPVEFSIFFIDYVFVDGFESTSVMKVLDYIDGMKSASSLDLNPTYDFETDSLHFLGHQLGLNNDYESLESMTKVRYWLLEVLILEDPKGDYDADGTINIDDRWPFFISK